MSLNSCFTSLVTRGMKLVRQRQPGASGHEGTHPTFGRREAIGAALGAGGALWVPQEGSAAQHSPTDATSPRINIRAFGAKGDRQSDDFDPIRRAIARAQQTDQYPASVLIPAGNFRRSESIALPNHLCLFGEGVGSILNSQNDHDFDRPILVNQSPAGLVSARLQDLALYGGSHGLRLNADKENADLRLHNVTMLLQKVANIEANKLLQTVKISNCVFGSAPYGIKVRGTGTNCFFAAASEWLDHSEGSIVLRGADGVTIVGGRFEGGGRPARYCIDIENASNVTFLGCFFENVHEFLARFRHITGTIVFQSCHFSGTSLGSGALRAFRWDIAETTVLFRDCVSLQTMPVGGYVMLEGSNPGIIASDVLVQGTQQSGRFLVQERLLVDDRPDLSIDATAAVGKWQLQGQLTVFGNAPGQIRTIIPISVNDASNDFVFASNAFTIRLTMSAPRQWVAMIEPGGGRRGVSLGYMFEWEFTSFNSLPAIRVPLT